MYVLEQYIEEALRSKKAHDSADLAKLDWLLGMCGESLELAEAIETRAPFAEVVKELGDNIWYATAMATEYPKEEQEWFDFNMQDVLNERKIGILISELKDNTLILAELYKKQLFHRNDVSDEIEKFRKVHLRIIKTICHCLNIDIADVARLNAAKLMHRHQGEYKFDKIADKHLKEEKFTDTVEYHNIMGRLRNAYSSGRA